MSDHLDEVSLEVLQHRLIEEVEAQQRLQEELKGCVRSEKQLRLENVCCGPISEDRHPGRCMDAEDMLARLTAGGELTDELKQSALAPFAAEPVRRSVSEYVERSARYPVCTKCITASKTSENSCLSPSYVDRRCINIGFGLECVTEKVRCPSEAA